MRKEQKKEEINKMVLNMEGGKTDIGTFHEIKSTGVYFVADNGMKFVMDISEFAKLNNVNPEVINDIQRKVNSE